MFWSAKHGVATAGNVRPVNLERPVDPATFALSPVDKLRHWLDYPLATTARPAPETDRGLKQSLSAKGHPSGWTSAVSRRSALAAVPLVLLGVLGLFSACSSAELEEVPVTPLIEPVEGPRLLFARETVDLGQVAASEPVQYDFRFKNVGNAPLAISEVTAKALEGC